MTEVVAALYDEIKDNNPIVLTRDMVKSRTWLQAKSEARSVQAYW